jgi:hypothetical protein
MSMRPSGPKPLPLDSVQKTATAAPGSNFNSAASARSRLPALFHVPATSLSALVGRTPRVINWSSGGAMGTSGYSLSRAVVLPWFATIRPSFWSRPYGRAGGRAAGKRAWGKLLIFNRKEKSIVCDS